MKGNCLFDQLQHFLASVGSGYTTREIWHLRAIIGRTFFNYNCVFHQGLPF